MPAGSLSQSPSYRLTASAPRSPSAPIQPLVGARPPVVGRERERREMSGKTVPVAEPETGADEDEDAERDGAEDARRQGPTRERRRARRQPRSRRL